MALLLPNLRRLLRYGTSIADSATRRAVLALEDYADELWRRLSVLEEAAGVASTRSISTTAPLTGGGDLSADRTFAISSFAGAGPGAVPDATAATAGTFLCEDGTWTAAGGYTAQSSLHGPGIDGALTFDGSSTVGTMAPVGGVYTLDRDYYPTNMTVNSGAYIACDGWGIWGSGTLTCNGTIYDDGTAGTTGGAGGSGRSGTNRRWGGGKNGGTNAPSGGTASSAIPAGYSTTSSTALGGSAGNPGTAGNVPHRGGGGGGSAAASGQNGGAITVLAASTVGGILAELMNGRNRSATQFTWGSGGGSGNATLAADRGTGGGGGGQVMVFFPAITGSGTISANGGNGGDGTNDGGGGGGGGGGLCWVIYGTRSGSLTISASGGTGGAATGTGAAGGNGAAGWAILTNVSGDGT